MSDTPEVALAHDCQGIEIEPGVYSGCSSKDTGAVDCPTCRGRTDARQAELDRASAALAVFQTQHPRRVRPVFLTGRRD